MPLVKCPECEKEISSTADKCVNRGHHEGFSTKNKARITIAFLLQLIALALLITCCYVYAFEGHYYNYYKSEFGSQFDYSGYEVHSDDCFGNIFLQQNNSIDPEISITTGVVFFSYVIIAVGSFGVAVYIYMLLQEKYLKNGYLIPGITVGLLLIHSILLSASKLDMVGTQGYYEIKPSVIWFIAVILEILAAVLGKKRANELIEGNLVKTQVITKDTEVSYVDEHGILYSNESDIIAQD